MNRTLRPTQALTILAVAFRANKAPAMATDAMAIHDRAGRGLPVDRDSLGYVIKAGAALARLDDTLAPAVHVLAGRNTAAGFNPSVSLS